MQWSSKGCSNLQASDPHPPLKAYNIFGFSNMKKTAFSPPGTYLPPSRKFSVRAFERYSFDKAPCWVFLAKMAVITNSRAGNYVVIRDSDPAPSGYYNLIRIQNLDPVLLESRIRFGLVLKVLSSVGFS